MTLREQFPDFFRLTRDLRAMVFNFDAPPPKRKYEVKEVLSGGKTVFSKVPAVTEEGKPVYEESPEQILQDDAPLEDSTLITSRHRFGRARNNGKGMHRVVLDIDCDAALIPSTTPGHHHLIIDRVMEWDDYEKLLKALADAGIIEQGYYQAASAKGYTGVRPPWVKKKKGVARPPAAFLTVDEIEAKAKDLKEKMMKEKEKWTTQTPSQKPGQSLKTDGAKVPYTVTETAAW